ncbi:ankyrin repeat-containing domain protein [Dendryphion nanum]|uniref:Ankyrin repeat-containing domain protein n=1 Tax=Dendryphion nanum TaxID=256645 RepID=A0A9P9ED72_9PLEO|nr:ankyrin repeat-containing domain protein [Dendryphion nanum]
MSELSLSEDSIDEILYLARANEPIEFESFVSQLSAQTTHSKAALVTAAVDPYSNNSALHYAAANGHTDVIKQILSYNQDKATSPVPGLINAVNDAGNTPLHWAALNGHLECVKLLIQAGADVTIINKAGHDAVFEAEINDKKNVVDWLLETVEELEKGIGQTGEGTGENGDGNDSGTEQKDDFGNAGKQPVTSVEGVTRQMEGMSTNGGSAQGG